MDPSSKRDNPGLLIDVDAAVAEKLQFDNDLPSGDFNAALAISDVFGGSSAPSIYPPSLIPRSSFGAPSPGANASSFSGGVSVNRGFGASPVPLLSEYVCAAPSGFLRSGFGPDHLINPARNGFGGTPAGFQKNGFGVPDDVSFRESERGNAGFDAKSPRNEHFGNVVRSESGFDSNNNSNGIIDPHFHASPSNSFAPVRLSPSSQFGRRNDQERDLSPAIPPLSQQNVPPSVFPAERRRDRCNKCGRYGHMTEHCFSHARNAGSIRCYNCNRVGHLAVRCFEPPVGLRGRPSVSLISGASPTHGNSLIDVHPQPLMSASGGRVSRPKFVDIVDPHNTAAPGVGIVCKVMQDPHLRKEVMRLVPEAYDDMMDFMMKHVKP